MSLVNHDTIRPGRSVTALRSPPRPAAEFLRAAVLGGICVAILSASLVGAAPWSIGAALGLYAAAAALTAILLDRDYPHPSLGLCNLVTLARLVCVAALVAPLMTATGPGWTIFAVGAFALSLDGIDGWLARRQNRVSAFGARFDMEVDAGLAFVLALNAAFGADYGLVAVLLGLPRYAFAAAGLALPWIRRPLPDRLGRKAVCVLQIGGLVALQAPVLPPLTATLLVPVTAGALLWSFARDVVWLWQRRA
jgi:phosphatidylglycerophosphate synthase